MLPFGLKTAVGSFTRAMDVILGPEVRESTFNFVDDLLIGSKSFEDHLADLDRVLTRLQDAGMTVNLEKSSFFKDEVHFLGHIISFRGISTDPAKVEAISKFPVPKSQKHLRAFLGLCNYYRRFCGRYSETMVPLIQFLKKGSRWNWGPVEQQAFEEAKELFLNTVMLKFSDFRKTFFLQTDSSGIALGVELYQLMEDNEHGVIGFASRALKVAELFFTVTEKKLLASVFGLQKFRTILLGHKVVIRTADYALKFLKLCRLLNDRLTRWSLFLNEFDYEVEHIRRVENVVADTLSRFPPELEIGVIKSPNIPLVGQASGCDINAETA